MYQMTDPTLAETRCIRDHIVVDDGCSWNALYPRVAPSRAVELTAVYLDRISRATERDLLLPFIAGLEHKAGGRVEGDLETDAIGDIWLVLVWSCQYKLRRHLIKYTELWIRKIAARRIPHLTGCTWYRLDAG
jgi:hypothetical protein